MSQETSEQEELSLLEAQVQAGEEELASLQRRLRVVTSEANAASNPGQFDGAPPPEVPRGTVTTLIVFLMGAFLGLLVRLVKRAVA